MEFVAALIDFSQLLFAAILLLGLFLAHEVGVRLGHREAGRPQAQTEGAGVIVGGLLGLLAFVLALTLSFASERFAERRAGALAESNAISTAWARAVVIGHPRGAEIARLLEEYAKIRLDFVESGRDKAKLDAINQATNALQSKMTGHLAAIVREQPNPVSAALMASLNDTFDAATSERFAYDRGLPARIFWLLIGLNFLGATAIGYQAGIRRNPLRALTLVLLLTWAIVLIDILDLASSRTGAFRTNADAYRWTIQSFQGGLQIPPAPPGRQ